MTRVGKGDTERNMRAVDNSALKQIPMGYLKKGDRFVATRGSKVWSGSAHMDGAWISPSYGFLSEYRRVPDPEREYINVHFDGQEYGWVDTPTRYRTNDSVFSRDGWKFYVTSDIAERVERDKKDVARIMSEDTVEARKKRDLKDQIAKLRGELDELERQAQAL